MTGEGGGGLAGVPWRSGSCARSRAEAALARQTRAHEKPRPMGPARSSPPHSATRSRMPTRPCPPLASPWAAGPSAAHAVGDLDLEHLLDQRSTTRARPRAPCLSALVRPSCTRRNAVGSTPGERPRAPLHAQLDVEPRVARSGR